MNVTRIAIAGGVAVSAIIAGLTTISPNLGLGFAALCAIGALTVRRPTALVAITIILAFCTTPAFVPNWISFGPVGLYPYEIGLIASFIWAIHRPVLRRVRLAMGLVIIWLMIGSFIGFISGATAVKVLGDIRYPAELAMAIVVAAACVRADMTNSLIRTIRLVLWISAGLVILSSISGFSVSGRSETAALLDQAGEGATRVLTSTNFLALAVLGVATTLLIANRTSFRDVWSYIAPATILVFLAFSRNHLIGIGVTILVALLMTQSTRRSANGTIKFLYAASVSVVSLIIITRFPTFFPGGSWISANVSGYVDRVLSGLTAETRAIDPSTQYREHEVAELSQEISDSPVFGHGFGYAYKDPIGKRGSFWFERAPYYAHNFYLWAWVKTGIVGLALALIALVGPVIRGLERTGDSISLAVSATALGLLAVCLVAPLPIDSPASLLVGALIGTVIAVGAQDAVSASYRAQQDSETDVLRVKPVVNAPE